MGSSPFHDRPFSPKPKKQKVELPADIFSDVDPFLDLDDATVTGIQPDSLVPVHMPECSEDTDSLAHSMDPSFTKFPLSAKSGYSYGTSTLTQSVSTRSQLFILCVILNVRWQVERAVYVKFGALLLTGIALSLHRFLVRL